MARRQKKDESATPSVEKVEKVERDEAVAKETEPLITPAEYVAKAQQRQSLLDIDRGEQKLFGELDGKFIHVRVGHPQWDAAATQAEMRRVESKLIELFTEHDVNCMVLVTSYGVDITLVEPAKK